MFDPKKYPPDWKQIRARILERARHRCEHCGVFNYAWGYRDAAGLFHEVNKRLLEAAGSDPPPFTMSCRWQDGTVGVIHVIKIILTTAHTCSCYPLCGIEEHLLALCQSCHLRLDGPLHRRNASATRWRKKSEAQGQHVLF